MISIGKTLLISTCAVSLAITGCAADGFFSAASAASKRPSELFDPPPMPNQPQSLVEEVVDTPTQVVDTPTPNVNRSAKRASFQLSDPPTVAADERSFAMQSTLPTTVRRTQSPPVKKSARTLVTLGPNDDLAAIVRAAPGVVLLDFYADWCGPCRTQGNILHELKATAAGRNASIIKVNVDQHEAIANVLKVSALPTLVLIKNGKIIERKTGLADQQQVSLMLAR